jgi:hypothetical protein
MKTIMHLGMLLCAIGLALGCENANDESSSRSQASVEQSESGSTSDEASVERPYTTLAISCPSGTYRVGECTSSVGERARCWSPTSRSFVRTKTGTCTGGRHCFTTFQRFVPRLGNDYKFVGCA